MMLWSTIFLGLSFFLILIQSFVFLANKSRSKKLPPGPTPLPIIGNLHSLGQQPHQSLANLAEKYGPIMSLKLGRITTVVISSSSLAKEVLQKQDLAFSSRFVPDAVHALDHHLYSVAWLPVGPRWRSLRKIMTTVMLSGKGLETNDHLRRKKVQELIAHCGNSCEEGKAFDVGRAAFLTSLNFVSNTIFSRDLTDPNQDSVNVLKELVCEIMVDAGKPNLADFFPVLKKIDPQGIRRSGTVHLDKLVQLLGDLIKERLELRKVQKKSSSGNSDLLDMCLDINEENPEEIDIALIQRLCVDLFLAGTDTTSITLEWAMAEVLRNPEIMMKVKLELDEVIGKGKILKEADISRLPYLQCIVKETLRLHPPGPFLVPRKVESNVEVNSYIVPKGSQVLINVWAIGRDPNLWKDSLTFNPERFLTLERDVMGQDFELIPFGAGRRICPGLPLAMRMVLVMLGSLLNSFDWKVGPDKLDMSEKFGLTLHKAHALKVVPMPVAIL
uniref:Cytochrome P450 oxidase 76B10-like protein n=1 Tax=Platycodon grandiflorus TaxID=94286 RepID=A0A2I7M6F9_PLAGD|nr:cytochrome P450 oxidase 76B10-like protein [Platycodon grandiflorus]